MAELFQTTPQNITLHLREIFADGELTEQATCKDTYRFDPRASGKSREKLRHYRLEASKPSSLSASASAVPAALNSANGPPSASTSTWSKASPSTTNASRTLPAPVTRTTSTSSWQPHIRTKSEREALAKRFKKPDDPLKLVIVRNMWLTGFDAPCVHTMYVDKPMKGHGLMQAIARVNRVFRDKPGVFSSTIWASRIN